MPNRTKQFFYPSQTSWPVIGLARGEGGGGVSWLVGTPTIAVVEPVTNPPSFDIGLDIAGGDATLPGDVAHTRIDGVYDPNYDATFDGDAVETVTGTTLSAGDHTADVAIFRLGVQVSAWSSAASFTVSVSSTAGQPIGLLLALLKAA